MQPGFANDRLLSATARVNEVYKNEIPGIKIDIHANCMAPETCIQKGINGNIKT